MKFKTNIAQLSTLLSMKQSKTVLLTLILVFWSPIILTKIFYRPSSTIDLNTKILFPDTTVHVTHNQVAEHNKQLSKLLLDRMNIEYSNDATRESSHQQMRGFYVLIVAGLLSIIFANPHRNSTRSVVIVLMVIIAGMYLVEVQQLDLNARSGAVSNVYSTAEFQLVDSLDSITKSSTWYVIDVDTLLHKQWVRAGKWPVRFKRKALEALNPSMDQFALFIFPLFVLLLWWRRLNYNDRHEKGQLQLKNKWLD